MDYHRNLGLTEIGSFEGILSPSASGLHDEWFVQVNLLVRLNFVKEILEESRVLNSAVLFASGMVPSC